MRQTRGVRNCNPGNIRLTRDRWAGMRSVQTDGAFVQFVDMEHGVRALLILLRRYYRSYGLRTVRLIVARYAPASENDTEAYVGYVARSLGVSADQTLPSMDFCGTMFDEATLFGFCKAVCWMESRYELSEDVFRRGLELCM